MVKQIGVKLIWLFLFLSCLLFYYLLRNTNQPLLFYSVTGMVIILCLVCFLLQLLQNSFRWRMVVSILFLGLLLVFVVRQSLDQRMNFYLQNSVRSELPGVVLDIKARSEHNAHWANPAISPESNSDETRTNGHFFPRLPHYWSEAMLADHPAQDVDTVSYRFIIKQPYIVDDKDVSAKYCFVWGVCSYFYKGYADVNVQTGEVVGLRIEYRDMK